MRNHFWQSLLLTILMWYGLIFIALAQTERRGGVVSTAVDTTSDFRYTSKYALLIGIDGYEAQSGFLPLRYAANDARALRKVLIERLKFPARNVRILINKEATSATSSK